MLLSEQDLKRFESLCLLDQAGRLHELMAQFANALRAEGIGQRRDPREGPFLRTCCRVYELMYGPPVPPNVDELAYVMFPSPRAEIADRLLAAMVAEIRAADGGGHGVVRRRS
jgi:hypothetical protein